MPTLILHGDDDQIVPIGAAALGSSKLVRNATLKIYAAHPTAWRTRTKTSSMPTCWHSLRPNFASPAPRGWWRRYWGRQTTARVQGTCDEQC